MSNITRFGTQRNYYKPSFVKALDKLIPRVYINYDLDLSATVLDPIEEIINSHIRIADNLSSVIPVSAITGTITSAIDTLEGISPYFVKQNQLSHITPIDFERNILLEFNVSFRNFDSSAALSTYLEDTLLPAIRLNSPTNFLSLGIPLTHNYLIEELSWLYFLNMEGTTGPAIVRDLIISKLYRGQDIDLNDCLKAFSKYLFDNIASNASWRTNGFIPDKYLPEQYLTTTNTWTSGTQQLDKLQTFIDIVYSPLYADIKDFQVKDAFDEYIDNSLLLSERESSGPFWRLIKAFSYSIFDVYNQIDEVRTLNDIDECKDELLPYIAELIGWPLFGSDPDRWRLQLANAVDVYKKAGTKDSIQFAINSIFSEDVFNISTSITELWESYIPHLIYYALATDSINFVDMDSWTQQKAAYLGVSGYSTSSMDENIRMAVDAIILETVNKYPESFRLAGKQFPLQSPKFVFNYRGRNYKVPPWEQYPYYANTELTEEQVDFIADRLVCFGVRNEFAIEILNYIKNNTLRVDDDVRLGNGWLFFTSGYNEPTNLENVIYTSTSNKTEYLSLWSGKSSHYKVSLDANDFDFSKDTIDSDSRETIVIAGKVLNEFSPAHSIPNLSLKLSALDDYVVASVILPLIDLQKMDYPRLKYSINSDLAGYGVSGLAMGSWKRNSQTGNDVTRSGLDSLTDPMLSTSAAISAPRNNFRRRNLKFLMPKNGYYDRTGFNSPLAWHMDYYIRNEGDTPERITKYLPLGFIPSSLSFELNPSAEVYGLCYTSGSTATFYGVPVSDFYPSRGWHSLGSNAKSSNAEPDSYVDRGQLDDIYWVMFKCIEGKKYWDAYLTVSADFENYSSSMSFKNVVQSVANQIDLPDSVYNYYNFEFGRDIHKLYRVYTSFFNRHTTRLDLIDLDGPNIYAHIFGSILRNSKFNRDGINSQFISNSVSSIQNLGLSNAVFSTDSYGRTLASSTSSMYVERPEIRNATILSGIELVITSGLSENNYFNVIYLDASARKTTQSEYMFDKTFVLSRAINGLPRLRYDLRSYPNPSIEGHPLLTNLLVPEHDFRLRVKALASNDNGTILGGLSLGVWIHTQSENGTTWSYTPKGEWVRHSSIITKQNLLDLYAHKRQTTDKVREFGSDPSGAGSRFQCLEVAVSSSIKPPVLTSYSENEFEIFEFNFNTKNKPILIPEDYYRVNQQLHRANQNYIFEVFVIPSQQNSNKFMLFDSVNLLDSTLNKWSQYLAAGLVSNFPIGPKYCEELRVPLEREEIRAILQYYNDLGNGYATRVFEDGDVTLGLFNMGGSRLDYRERPEWTGITLG
jgi:hypothetical protein